MKARSVTLALAVAALSGSAFADDPAEQQKVVTEAEVRLLSDTIYTELLRGSHLRGHHFAPEQVANGYKRHLEELRLQLLDQSYTILAGEAGA